MGWKSFRGTIFMGKRFWPWFLEKLLVSQFSGSFFFGSAGEGHWFDAFPVVQFWDLFPWFVFFLPPQGQTVYVWYSLLTFTLKWIQERGKYIPDTWMIMGNDQRYWSQIGSSQCVLKNVYPTLVGFLESWIHCLDIPGLFLGTIKLYPKNPHDFGKSFQTSTIFGFFWVSSGSFAGASAINPKMI